MESTDCFRYSDCVSREFASVVRGPLADTAGFNFYIEVLTKRNALGDDRLYLETPPVLEADPSNQMVPVSRGIPRLD